jgi:hypothetical protein
VCGEKTVISKKVEKHLKRQAMPLRKQVSRRWELSLLAGLCLLYHREDDVQSPMEGERPNTKTEMEAKAIFTNRLIKKAKVGST